ncbi:MAG: hypothetical protein ACRDIE_06075 [Chloroflexota bacterium]
MGILATALGIELKAIDLSPEQVRAAMIGQGMPAERANVVLAARRSGGSGLGMTVFPTVERITGRPPRSYAEWVEAHLDAFQS